MNFEEVASALRMLKVYMFISVFLIDYAIWV